MAEKAEENAAVKAEAEESEVESDRESEEGIEPPSSPVKSVKSPAKKKKKVTNAGMQIPEHWPWEEAKKLFITPDVVKGDELEVSSRAYANIELMIRLNGKRPMSMVLSSSFVETRVSSE
jgi:hypothetical protein